jgi:hypothetical protein
VVEAVALGVESDLGVPPQPLGEPREVGLGSDPARRGRQVFRARMACSIRWKRRRSGSSPSSWVMT